MTLPTAATAPTRLHVERRFPLDLSESLSPIRELYESAKQARWDPVRDVPWKDLDAGRFEPAVREAARAVWSRRAWIEYTGLAETPALLIRFCLETDREADPKYFLTVRNTEEAWHVEACHLAAEAFGGYLARPSDPAWEPVFNQALHRQALDADRPLDAYVAVQCALADGLEVALYRAYAGAASEPVSADLLRRIAGDKARHAEFGWRYLEARCADAQPAARAAIAEAIAQWIAGVACSGYHVPSLATTIDASPQIEAAARVARAGLGALEAAAEERLVVDCLAQARQRFAALGIVVPRVEHPRLGPL